MSMDQIIRSEARLIILKALAEQSDGRLNSALIQQSLQEFGITKTRDWVHDELRWLKEMGAVTIVEAGTVRVAALTTKGQEHVDRLSVIEGIKRPSMIGV